MNILNDVLANRDIDDAVQLAKFSDFQTLLEGKAFQLMAEMENNPEETAKLSVDPLSKEEAVTLKYLPQNDKDVEPRTMNTRHDFSKEKTQALLALCKQKKVTL